MIKNKLFISISVIILNLISFVSAHTGNDEIDHCEGFCPMMSGAYGGFWAIFGWALGILMLVVLVLFIVWLIKQIKEKK